MVEVGEQRNRVNGLDLALGLRRASEAAYAAIGEPVEGTILTVIRETADAAERAAEHDPDLESVLAAAVAAATASVERTPSLLPILREAGVVDSGAQGLFRLLEGALAAMRPDTVAAGITLARSTRAPLGDHAETGFGYETMFLVTADDAPLDLRAIRGELERLGESVLVAGDERAARVHVHNVRPDTVLAYGLTLGTLTRITIENLDSQTLAVAEARAAAFTRVGATATRTPSPASPSAFVADRPGAARPLAVIAVAPGEGLGRAMQSAGATTIIPGGRSANPSAGELLDAIRATGAAEVIILPNDRNVRLAAQQAAALAVGTTVLVVPTRTATEGIAALLALDPRRDASENGTGMRAAAGSVRTLSVTTAVRDGRFGDRNVRKGQTIVLDADEGLVAAHRHRTTAVLSAVASLQGGIELLTIYYGEGADLAAAEGLAQTLAEAHVGVEVEIIHGGQPHYPYLIAAES